jgi:hypothetical protein
MQGLMEQIIELHEYDDIHSIRDRLAMAQSSRVLLVLPWDSPVLRSAVDLQIVQRFAEAQRLEIGIVSEEHEVRNTAAELGLPAFRSIEAAQRRKHWHQPLDDEEELGPWKPSERRKREAQRAAVERDQAAAQARKRSPYWRYLKYGLVAVVVLTLFVSALAIIPSADVVLIPRSTQIVVNVSAIADPDADSVDYVTGHVPATSITVEVRDQTTVSTTGKRGIPDTRASGTVLFVNQLNTPIRISQGTAVRTSATSQAIRFIVTQDVDVPGGIGAQAEAPIEAVEPGFQGNVPANFINEVEGVAALAVRVSNPNPLSGGGEKEVRSVDPADRDTARAQLAPILREDAIKKFQDLLASGEFIIPESINGTILESTFDHEVTEQADDLTLLMRVQYTVLKVKSEDANSLVFAAMQHQSPPEYALIPQGLSFQRGSAQAVPNSDTLFQFQMQGVGYAAADLDISHATHQITGKSIGTADETLKKLLPLKRDPDIKIFPSWFPTMPWLTFRIHVDVVPQG